MFNLLCTFSLLVSINSVCIAMKCLPLSPFNHLRSLRSYIENCDRVGFVKLTMWNIIFWLLGIVVFKWLHCSHAIRAFLHDLPWQRKWTKYTCFDISGFPCCQFNETLHLTFHGNCEKITFLFLNKSCFSLLCWEIFSVYSL